MTERRYEARGVRCLECHGLDLQSHPDQARGGFGWCAAKPVPQFISVAMSRNCMEFDRAPDEVVGPSEEWTKKLKLFWQK